MSYIETARAALLAALGDEEAAWGDDTALLDAYTQLVLTLGTEITTEHVHDAWALIRQRTLPAHMALAPYGQLGTPSGTHDLAEVHRDAIRAAAGILAAGDDRLRQAFLALRDPSSPQRLREDIDAALGLFAIGASEQVAIWAAAAAGDPDVDITDARGMWESLPVADRRRWAAAAERAIRAGLHLRSTEERTTAP